ncbi:MAG: SDR family NAD(P)-dependent oxidoreductase, partial [Paludibacter sp.]|nr:SDR family NAD(P)-dependent oxidoreductase [Paludibacter sp.]
MKNFTGKRILITGGASGIGKIMGKLTLQRGAELIIWDINQTSIDETLAELAPFGKVSAYKIDLSEPEQ